MSRTILLRGDGNNEIGLGHFYRLLALAEMFKSQFDLHFVTRDTSVISNIVDNYKFKLVPEDVNLEDEPKWFSANFTPNQHIIVLDGYQFTTEYQKGLKENGFLLIYIDDLMKEEMWADIVINHSPSVRESDYKKQSYTRLALGTRYAILRPRFLKAAKEYRALGNIESAFICFGGADHFDLTLKATKALIQISQIQKIHVVLGGAYNHTDIHGLQEKYEKLQVYNNLNEDELCQLMMNCQIAIAPSSTILYELCAIKMPILSGYFVENQIQIYKALSKYKAIAPAGDLTNYSISNFKKGIVALLKQTDLESYLKQQQKLFDGNSAKRIFKLLNQKLIKLRKANKKDIQIVLDWSNDSVVRQNSYNSEIINLDKHKEWFYSKIKDAQTLFLIALYDNQEAGMVRFEIKGEHSIVGISISQNFRGKNLASIFLSLSAKEYFNNYELPVLAYIKEDNIASSKSFESAGYTFYEKKIIDGISSFVYKLEKNNVIK